MEHWLKRSETSLEMAALVVAFFAYFHRWLAFFLIWPDSAIYLSAAANLVDHGSFFIYANYPSNSLLPQTELYSDYPPGFPLYLASFYFFLRDPLLTAYWAQACALALFTLATWGTARALGLSFGWRIFAVFFFTVFTGHRILVFSLLNEILYISLCLGCFLASLALMRKNRPWLWAAAYGCLLGSAAIRWNGLANGIFLLFPIYRHFRAPSAGPTVARLGLAAVAGLGPNLIWFWRNSLYGNKGTAMHDFSRIQRILWEKAGVPFENMALRWGFGHLWVFLLLLAFALSPYFLRRARTDPAAFGLLVAGALSQFLVIYALSLVFHVTPLDDRYLAPAYTFFAFLLIHAAHAYTADWRIQRLAPAAAALALAAAVLLLGRHYYHRYQDTGSPFTANRPREFYLWQVLRHRPYAQAADRYFTDDDFVHQIFFPRPQRLVYSNRLLHEPDLAEKMKAPGPRYFIVTQPGSELQLWTENFRPKLHREKIGEFLVYHP